MCDLASHKGFELCVRAPHEIAEEHLGIAQERLGAFLKTEFPGCERVLRSGDAAEEIAEVARRLRSPHHANARWAVPPNAPRVDYGEGTE